MRVVSFIMGLLAIGFLENRLLAADDNPVGDVGLLVAVPSPLTSDDVTRITKRVDEARGKGTQRPAKIIFDFTPNDKDAQTTSFGPCFDLADYISKLHDVATIAYLRKKVSGHTVLPLLACKDIVMSDGASFGEIVQPGAEPLGPAQANNYQSLLATDRAARMALIRKMYDPSVQVLRGQKNGGEWFVVERERAEAEKQGVVIPDAKPLALPTPAVYSADRARELGLCKAKAQNREELATLYNIATATLRDDPLSDRTPTAFRLTLSGRIDQRMKETVARTLREVVRQKGNLLFLHLECGGGDFSAARALADEIVKYSRAPSGEGVKVVAVIPDRAPDTATVVALGCSEIVMSKRRDFTTAGGDPAPEAEIGDFEEFLKTTKTADAEERAVVELAQMQGYPTLLIQGMFQRNLEIYRVRNKVDRTKRQLMTKQEFDSKRAEWESDGLVKPAGQLLKLNATQAEQLGLVRLVVDTRDPNEVYEKYGVAGKVKEATPAWLDQFAAYLRLEIVTVLLVVIGFLGLLLELKVPGTAVPGIISALCFILVFWAHTQFSGQTVVLAGLLFLLGLVLVLLEVFVFPGFGAAGVFGIMLMLASLGLVTMEQIPQTGDQWLKFGRKTSQYLFSLIAAMIAAFFLARYLPKMPFGKQLALGSPADNESEEGGASLLPGAAFAATLLGAIGVASTVLRPAGTVRIGDQFVDVVTEGGFIPAGTRVQVIEVEGTRIVVKEV